MAVVRHKCCSVSALSPAGMTNQSLSLFYSLQWRPAEFPGGKVYTFLKKKKKKKKKKTGDEKENTHSFLLRRLIRLKELM